MMILCGLMDKVSASQPRDRGFDRHTGHDHDFSYDTSTGWLQKVDSRVIKISCKNVLYNRAKINMFKLNYFLFLLDISMPFCYWNPHLLHIK